MRTQGLMRFGALILLTSAVLMESSPPVYARRSTASVFQMLDSNKDGTVDEAETRQAASALFDRLDTDRDGTLDANELRGHLSNEELQSNDADHDATLTKDEYLAIVEQRFKAADANHDGKLKIDEFTSAPGAALVKLITYQVEGVHPTRRSAEFRVRRLNPRRRQWSIAGLNQGFGSNQPTGFNEIAWFDQGARLD